MTTIPPDKLPSPADEPAADEQTKRPKSFRTKAVSLGPCLVGDLDNIAEALALAEGDAFR